MSDKLVRDELLRSHRYQTLSSDTAKLLFFHILLSSDGHSNAEVTSTALSILMRREISEEIGAPLLAELADKDLLRLYEYDGKRYAHIPRSRQRIRYPTSKHPRPPKSIEDKNISTLITKVGGSRAEVGRSEVVVVEVLKTRTTDEAVDKSDDQPATATKIKPESWAERWTSKGKALSMNPNPGESTRDYCMRVIERCKGR